jgi:predicted nucleic acid-binding protein
MTQVTSDRVLLDTDVVIELLKKNAKLVARFLELIEADTVFLISPIVVAEIYAGAFEREYKQIEALFDLCQRIELNSDAGREAGLYANTYSKAFQGVSLEDYFLAASARVLGCSLWTLNKKHYPMKDIALFA